MAFDPTKPAQNAPIISAELREQFNALNDRITALEAALADSARNPTTVNPVSLSLSDPATGPQVQVLLDSHNALINALLRL